MAKPVVVYWLKFPSPYFVDRCNAVAARDAVELEVWFDVREPDKWGWDVVEADWRFPARYVPTRRLAGLPNRLPLPELEDRRPDLFVAEYDSAQLTLGFLAARAAARRTAFRVLPTYDAWSDRTWWREAGKHVVFRAVDAAKVAGEDGADLARRYGLPPDRTWDVTQSIDVRHYASARDVNGAERHRGRRDLGLSGTVLIYVGRLWDGKGVPHLLDAFARLVRDGCDVSLLLVGSGPDEAAYRERLRDEPRAVFAGWQQRHRMPWFYALADVMVFPTLGDPNGLVVTEALAAGLPVVSSDAAGNIRRRLPPDGPGIVVPAGDVGALTDALRRLVADADLRASMAARAYDHVRHMDSERYADDFLGFVHDVLARPRRRTLAAAAARVAGRALLATGAKVMAPPAPLLHSGRDASG